MTRVILLTRGRETLVDSTDYKVFSRWNWRWETAGSGLGYAARWICERSRRSPTRVYLHRVILQAPDEIDVDHINGNSLDNRKCNLRLASKKGNAWNRAKSLTRITSSQYKGVYFYKREQAWIARIMKDGNLKYIGKFENEADAAKAYDIAAIEHFGDFARLNFAT